jgi:predicted metal-dependent hydrolase
MARRALQHLGTDSIWLGGRRVKVTLRRNHRAKKTWIKLEDHSGLVVVLPPWAHADMAAHYLRQHREWVLSQLGRWEERLADALPPLGTGRTVVYRGRPITLRVRSCACQEPSVEWHRDHVMVRMPRHANPPLTEVLQASYRAKAREVILRRTEALSELLGVRPRRVSIRDQKTRWGACTARGTLTFSWRLVLAPPSVLDYVVIHELCHLRHHHHGKTFWQMVESACPAFETHRAWLRENGTALRLA